MKLYDVLVEKTEGKPAVVFEYVNGTDFENFSKTVQEIDLRYYMKELLRALAFTHKSGIIHRDIKPSNVMFDILQRQSRLIDFSLARFHYDGENHTVAGSLNYKAPEILLYNRQYGPPADMWSFGCILASILFQKEPFFHGHDVDGQLAEISKVLGSDDFVNYVTALNIPHNPNDAAFRDNNPKIDFNTFKSNKNAHLATDLAIDVISKLLM
jgi:casein kinase II subunit alpha